MTKKNVKRRTLAKPESKVYAMVFGCVPPTDIPTQDLDDISPSTFTFACSTANNGVIEVWAGHDMYDFRNGIVADDDIYPAAPLSEIIADFIQEESAGTLYDVDAVARLRRAIEEGFTIGIGNKQPGKEHEGCLIPA